MTIAEQLKFIRAAFADWAQNLGGTAEIAGDPAHLFGLLMAKPGAARAIALFDSETPIGEPVDGGKVDRKYLLCMSRGRGFTLTAGDALTESSGRGEAMFDLVESAREVVRALNFDDTTTDGQPYYGGCRRVELEGLVVDAYQIEFTITTQLP